MNYQEIESFLKTRDFTMKRYEREGYDAFLKRVSFTLHFPFIHIAGSNGKSSVANYLSNAYLAAGYHVASFIKPFWADAKEMIRFDGKRIEEGEFARIFNIYEKEIKASSLSRFEIETFVAFSFFNEMRPDVAIIECGMGGALDSTNILDATPLLSIITSVSLEHTKFLGDTLSSIALQKAGIIKENSLLLLSSSLEKEAKEVFEREARKKNTSTFYVSAIGNVSYLAPYLHFDYPPYRDLMVLSLARYEAFDASIAIEALKLLRTKLPVGEGNVRKALLERPLPARLERFKNIYLDGAHNPEATKAMLDSLAPFLKGKNLHVLFAAYKDKDIMRELSLIGHYSEDIVLTSFDAPRARGKEDYSNFTGKTSFNPSFKLALNNLLIDFPKDPILVTGSLEFAYRVRKYIQEELHYE